MERDKWILGFDIGGTKTAVLLSRVDLSGMVRSEFPTSTHLGPQQTISNMMATAETLLREASIEPMELGGIGVSCGGPLDSSKGIILSPPNLPGWDDIPITGILADRFGCGVRLQNDANACALAEWRYGAGRGTRNMVFLTFGTGMGAGIVVDGCLLEGSNGNGGEVGHIRLASRGPVGYGKAGSFEGFCSGGGIAQLARAEASKLISKGIIPGFCVDVGKIGDISAKDVAVAADAGDPHAQGILKVSGQRLGMGLSILIDILNPEVIAIGSIFARCRKHLWPHAERIIGREALSQSASVCRVVPSELGEGIGDYACLGLAALVCEDNL